METYQNELTRIKKILRENPKGMTVTDISRKININRNSVAKYLDILLISGHAEMITFGPAKVFFPSRRVPISHLLNYSSDYILILDKDLNVVQANENILGFLDVERQELIGQHLHDAVLPHIGGPAVLSNVQEILEGREPVKQLSYHLEDKDLYFHMKILPTAFEDGVLGIAIIMNDITGQKRVEKALRESEEKFKDLFEKIRKKSQG